MEFLPINEFRKCVARYNDNYKIKSFTCWDQFLCMAFAQLTYRESLRDIQACLRGTRQKLYHMGIRGNVSRNTLANANKVRDWRIYSDFAQVLIGKAKRLYSRTIDKLTGIQCDQTIVPQNFYAQKNYPEKLRRIRYLDAKTNKRLVFLTNNFTLPAKTIAELYQYRWQIELFFKWIKQHLRIKAFYGTSENAITTQIWIARSIYVLVALIKKDLKLDQNLYTILQVLSVTLFEKEPILQILTNNNYINPTPVPSNQLNLFE